MANSQEHPKRSLMGFDFTPTIHNDTYPFIDPRSQNMSGISVLVTGASRGIGRATCLSYARAGVSNIAVGARSSLDSLVEDINAAAKEAGKPEPKVLPLTLDITDESSVEAARASVEKEFGRLDILYNNGGYLEPFLPVTESRTDEWWYTMTVNIKGPYLVTKAFIPLLLRTSNGLKTVLNAASVGLHTVRAGGSGYQGSKLWVMRFGEYLMKEYGDQGLLAFCIHPGSVMTELASGMPKEMHHVLVDTPELSGDSIMWLTKERREWLNGRYASVEWDMAELEGMQKEIVERDLLKMRMTV
ncbi:NAD-P-binding protein [Rhizodiscina lignyota]|uniref:NAD-P-binding protein n=1 Tax=Rhizodiscina lignyota TaxID=1504668 RepID=A0A9P4ID29_9PEZI|nr:NAD-P-binding protein [Rhizodiscina lignyota]